MNLNELLKRAEIFHQENKLVQAEDAYKAALIRFDSNDARFGLATLYTHVNKYDSAIELFTKAIEVEPNAVDIALNFAICLKNSENSERAIKLISQFKKHLPNDASVLNSFAHMALSLNQPELSINILSKYEQSNFQSILILAKAYMAQESWHNAINIWKNINTRFTPQADTHLNISICYAKIREYQLAISEFQSFLSYSVLSGSNALKFSDLYILARDISNARKQLNLAIKLGDISLLRYETEVRICRLEHDEHGAIAAADLALQIDAMSYVAWSAKREIGNHNTQAIEGLKHLLTSNVANNYSNQQNLFTLAKAHEKQEQYRLAFKCFNKANLLQEAIINQSNLNYDYKASERKYQLLKNVSFPLETTGTNEPKNIFIVGMPRSGTTLMDRLFSQHSKILSSGENEALAFFIENKINKNIVQNNYDWQTFFLENAEELNNSYYLKTALNSDVIVDKMPHNFRYVGSILSIFKNVKVVQMRRSPEDLALSIFSQPFAPHHNYAANLKTIAHEIFLANKLMDFWAASFPDQVINVDYNQLTNNPEETASEVYKFCHLEWKSTYLDFHKKHVASFTFSELQVRQPINTLKQNFSRHYEKELLEFKDYYRNLTQT